MKKSELRMIIREIVREEVAMSIQKVIKEIKEPIQDIGKPLSKKKVVKKKHYSKNSVLNDVLNETAMSGKGDEWETLGGSTYTTDRMNEVVGSSYADMMNGGEKPNADTVVKSMGGDPSVVGDTLKTALTRDYSDLMKAMDKKK